MAGVPLASPFTLPCPVIRAPAASSEPAIEDVRPAAALVSAQGPPPLPTDVPPLPQVNPGTPTLFLVGDSTVRVGLAGQMGWGGRR